MNLYFNGANNVFRHDATLSAWWTHDPLNPLVPSQTSQMDESFLNQRVEFADGYVQHYQTTLRNTIRRLTLNFEKRDVAVITALRRFFVGEGSNSIYWREPSEYFFWTPPPPWGPVDGLAVKWLPIDAIRIAPVSGTIWSLTVNIEESTQP